MWFFVPESSTFDHLRHATLMNKNTIPKITYLRIIKFHLIKLVVKIKQKNIYNIFVSDFIFNFTKLKLKVIIYYNQKNLKTTNFTTQPNAC